MKLNIFAVLVLFNCVNLASGDDGSTAGIIIGIIAGLLAIVGFFLIFYCCYLKKRRLKDVSDRSNARTSPISPTNQSVPYGNPNNYVPSNHHTSNSSRQNSYNNRSSNRSQPGANHFQAPYNQSLPLQPPPYSSLASDNQKSIQYTTTSGQHPAKDLFGHDNPAFFNRSISSFAEFPSMSDILLTSSKTSLPAAVMLESGVHRSNKFSDSAKGDSIESKAFKAVRHAYDNPRFTYSPETYRKHNNDKNVNNDILNECFETYSDSDSENVNFNPNEKWLDTNKSRISQNKGSNDLDPYRPIKQSKKLSTVQIPNRSKFKSNKNVDEHLQSGTKLYQEINEEASSSAEVSKKTNNKGKKSKKKSDSSDSGAEVTLGEVTMNPKGKELESMYKTKHHENRHSKTSSDSGMDEISSATYSDSRQSKLKNSSKLMWVAVEENDDTPPPTIWKKSISTDV